MEGRRAKGKKNIRTVRRLMRVIKRQIEEQPPEWVININNCLKEGPDYDSGIINRVPRKLREVYGNAYVPQIISVGPFHYGDQGLQVMEEHKLRYLLRLLGGQLQENGEHKAIRSEDLAGAMRVLEQKTRERYSEAFDQISSDEFVKMMVVDGCFVIELLRLYYKYFIKKEIVDDLIFSTRSRVRTLQRDLLMLENQLPFFVLEELFKQTSLAEEPSLTELMLIFFDPLLPRIKNTPKLDPVEKFDHMLDVLRSIFLSKSVDDKIPKFGWMQQETTANNPLVAERSLISHCVMELQEAGVKFKRREGCELLDIKFERGVLEIPPLYIDDNNLHLFLNFVALEQCNRDAKPFFINFFMFFNGLINSPNDIEILHKNGIINHVFDGDKDGIVSLLKKLCREIVYDKDESYLSKELKAINNHYKCRAPIATKWHVWWENLIRDYFSSPWTFLSLLAAITLLILTAVQTSYALLAYYRPPPP